MKIRKNGRGRKQGGTGMSGKREQNKRWGRLPGLLALLAATALLLPSAAISRGVDSPLEEIPAAVIGGAWVIPDLEEAPPEEPPAALDEAGPPDELAVPEEPAAPAEPVEETLPVEDTYFETAAFLGDSRTDGFRLYSGLTAGTYYVATGATVESVFSKAVDTEAGNMPLLDAMAQAETDPERIYVMLGVNELGWPRTEDFHDQYAKLIDRLRQDHPESEVILQSLMPVSKLQEEKKSYVNNERIALYNQVIRQVAGEKDCPLVDVAAAVTDEEGCLRADWTYDGVHLNTAGCQAWLVYLRTHAVGWEAQPPEEGP